MKKNTDRSDDYKETINKCLKLSEAGNFIFRGTSRQYFKKDGNKVTSTLYRELLERVSDPENYDICRGEKVFVDSIRSSLPEYSSNIELLTLIRYFGKPLAIIDFSKSIYVALRFACLGDFESDGELIICKTPPAVDEISYDEASIDRNGPVVSIEPPCIEMWADRIRAQQSIYVRAPIGYIGKNGDGVSLVNVPIPGRHKSGILDHLRTHYGISN